MEPLGQGFVEVIDDQIVHGEAHIVEEAFADLGAGDGDAGKGRKVAGHVVAAASLELFAEDGRPVL